MSSELFNLSTLATFQLMTTIIFESVSGRYYKQEQRQNVTAKATFKIQI